MAKKQFVPSENDLKLAISEIKYELDGFNWCFSQLVNPSVKLENKKNVFIELLLLHCRNLLGFFVDDFKANDDILALHYVGSPDEWLKNKWDQMPYLKKNKNLINKLLSHLTYSRINRKTDWDYILIHKELNSKWNNFLTTIVNHRKCWFD